jgi:hypothetical protein
MRWKSLPANLGKDKKPRKRTVYHEYNECCAMIDHVQWEMPFVYEMLTLIEQGGKRSEAQAARLKRIGLKIGVHDYFLFIPRGKLHGLSIEMKRPEDATVNKPVISNEQLDWQFKLRSQGYAAYICYSAEEAIDVIKRYMKLGSPRQCNCLTI